MQTEIQNKGIKNPANLFVLNMLVVYLLWKAFSYYQKHTHGFVHIKWQKIIVFLGGVYAAITSFILNIFGEYTLHNGFEVFYPTQNKIIRIEDHCLALPATVIFVGTILLFKGDWRNKLWFIPLGILLIVIINLVRLVFVCETFVYFTKEFFEINHSVIYVIITYALIFLLIVWWMKKFAG